MPGIIEGYNYDIRLCLSYGGHVFISYRHKNEGARERGSDGAKTSFEMKIG